MSSTITVHLMMTFLYLPGTLKRRKGQDNLRGLQKQLILGMNFLYSNLAKQLLQLLLKMKKWVPWQNQSTRVWGLREHLI